jgi:hypothetical protein
MNSLVGVNPHGSAEKVKLFLNSSHLKPQAVRPQRKYRSGFTTLPPVPLQEQPAVVLLLKRALVSWSLAMDERGGHQDLRGSVHWSIIPYVHRRTELYCSSLLYLSLFFFSDPCEVASARAFYSSRSGSYHES